MKITSGSRSVLELEDLELALASKPVEAKGPVTIERV